MFGFNLFQTSKLKVIPLSPYFYVRTHVNFTRVNKIEAIGNLSKHVFERCTSTGSKAFSSFLCLDANKFSLLTFSSLIKTLYPRVLTKPLPNDAKRSLPVDVRRSKTLLLKLPNLWNTLRERKLSSQ